MSTISITTTQNIELEYELASLGDRILGRILDGLVIAGYVILLLIIIGFGNFDDFINDNVWFVIIFSLPVFFYDLVCEIIFNGQSAGKRVMGIKVISLNGSQATLGQYLIRWLFRLIDFSISGSLVGLIMVAATEKHQRLGDMVAGTTLVKTKPRSSLQQTLYMPTIETNYTVTYPEVVQLSDNDIQLVKEVLTAVQKGGSSMLAFQAMQKIEAVLHIQRKQYEPIVFLHTVLADYNHLTSKL